MKPEIGHALKVLEVEPRNPESLAALDSLVTAAGRSTDVAGARLALAEARRLQRERGDDELVARLFEAQLALSESPAERAGLLIEKARFLVEERHDDAAAAAALREAAGLPGLDDPGHAEEALAALDAERAGWADRVAALVAEEPKAGDRAQQAAAYLAAAELAWRFGGGASDGDRSVDALIRRALDRDPRHRRAAQLVEKRLRDAGNFVGLGAHLAARADLAGLAKEDRTATLLALAEVQAGPLGRRDLAIGTFQRVVAIDPASPRAVRALAQVLTDEGDWLGLVRLYENALKSRRGESEEVRQLLLRLGSVLFDKLGQAEAAEAHFARVRKSQPHNAAALDFYRAYHGERGEGQKLLVVLSAAHKAETDPAARLSLALEMAHLAEAQAANPEKAIEVWRGIARGASGTPGGEEAAAQAQVALKRLYAGAGKWNALLELLKEEAERVVIPDGDSAERREAVARRVGILFEVAAVYRDRLGLDAMVVSTLNAVLALQPDNADAISALSAKYEQMGRWNELIGLLSRRASDTADPRVRGQLLRRVAQLWLEKFNNQNQALKPLEELDALGQGDADTTARLRDLYTRRRAWKPLLELGAREAARTADPAQRRHLRMEMARLASEKLGDPREAIAIWNSLLEADDLDGEALAGLATLYEREKRWPALLEVLRRQRALLGDNRQLVLLLERIGAVAGEKMGAREVAAEAYRDVMRLSPGHPRALRLLRDLLLAGADLDGLEQVYAEHGSPDELCDTLMSLAEKTSDPSVRARALFRVADVASSRLDQPERAIKALERVLAGAAPGAAQPVPGESVGRAAVELARLYRTTERWSKLAGAYETLLLHSTDDEERKALLVKLAELCEDKLDNPAQAFAWVARAFALSPGDESLDGELARLAGAGEAWEPLATLLGEHLDGAVGERRVRQLRLLGTTWLDRLGRIDEARGAWEKLLDEVPGDAEALAALERIHARSGSHVDLLAVLRRRFEHAVEPAARIDLLFKIASIEEEQLGDLDAAAQTLERVLDEDPASLTALRGLERIYAVRGRYDRLADTLTRQLDLATEPRVESEIAHRLGELFESELEKPAEALGWYERAFARDPSYRPTMAALERALATEGPGQVHVAALLEPAFAAADDVDKQVRALRVLLAAADGPEPPIEAGDAAVHLRALVRITGRRMGDVEAAYGYCARLFALFPDDVEVRRELRDIADATSNHADLAARLEEVGQRVEKSDVELARDLAWELGGLYAGPLARKADAERAWLQVLALDERHAGALDALEALYRDDGRAGELRRLLERRLLLADGDEAQRDLLFRIAALDEDLLGDAAAAVTTYERILDAVAPGADWWRAFTALERLLTRTGGWARLDALYGAAIDHADGESQRADLRYRRGLLHLRHLDDAEGGLDLFEEAIGEQLDHPGARAAVEGLLDVPALRQRAARVLEPLHIAAGDWPRLLAVLDAQVESAPPAEAAELLGRMASVAEEELGDAARAFTAWRRALVADPGQAEPRAQLLRLAGRLDRVRDLADALEEAERAADVDDLALRRNLLDEAARLWEGAAADLGRAKAAWLRVLDLDPASIEACRPAADALARLYEAEGGWVDLVRVLRLQAEWAGLDASPGPTRRALLRRVASVEEDLIGDRAAAVRTHREILDADPADAEELDALERLLSSLSEWREVVATLRLRLDLTTDPEARRALLTRIARLVEERLVAPAASADDDAVGAWSQVLDEQPQDTTALEALARLHFAAGRDADLMDILERRLAVALADNDGPLAERQGLRARIAGLLAGPLGSPEQALDRYREMLADDPADTAARAGLEQMLGEDDLRLRAAEVLEPIYLARSDDASLVRIGELWAEHASDPPERIARLRGVAAIHRRGGDVRATFDALSRAARLAAGEPEMGAILDELIEAAGADAALPGELAALLRDLSPDILDAGLQERALLVVAEHARASGDLPTARDYYRRVLDAQPEHAGALEALDGVYRAQGDHEALLEVSLRRARLAEDPAARRGHLLSAAGLCEGPLARPDEAVAFYHQILELEPDDAEASARLEALLAGGGRFGDLADLLERRLGFASDTSEAVALQLRLGRLFEQELGDTARALESYRAALAGDPSSAEAVAGVERFLESEDHRVEAAELLDAVYAARHDWRALIHTHEIRLEATVDPARRLALTRRIARLYEETLEDLDGAFTWYGRLFREAPEDRAIREQLGRLADILGAHARMADVFEGWLQDVYEETPGSIEVLRTLAAIYDGRLADPVKAKRCYLRLLKHDPADVSAFHLLENSLTRGGRWADLCEVYREIADGTSDPARRKVLLYKIADLRRLELDDREGAIQVYGEIRELDPGDTLVVRALDELLTQAARWQDLVRHLEGQIADEAGQALDLKVRLATVLVDRLGDAAAAVDQLEEVVASDPAHEGARVLLERLLADGRVRSRVARVVEPVYLAQDDWHKLVAAYEAQLESETDRDRRVWLLRETARLYEERDGNLTVAFDALAHAWTEESREGLEREEPLYLELSALAEQSDSWKELLEVVSAAVPTATDDESRARFVERTAEILERRLRDPVRAVAAWREVCRLVPDDPGPWVALERLLSAANKPDELVEVLERRAALSSEPADQRALWYRAADLLERTLGDKPGAIRAWQQVVTLDETDGRAMSALERLLGETGRNRELCEVLARRIELGPPEAERRRLRLALAETREALGDTAGALSAWRAITDEWPTDAGAIRALLRLHEKEGMWPELLETLDAAANLAPPGPERDALRFRAGRVLEEHQRDALGAVDRYRQVLADEPNHAEARQALEHLLDDDETTEAAAAVLEPIYRAAGDHRALVRVLSLRAERGADGEARRDLLADIAMVEERGLGDDDAAFATWGRVLAEDASDSVALAQLDRLAARTGAYRRLHDLLAERAAGVGDVEVERTLVVRMASIAEDKLHDAARAADHYRHAVDLPGDELPALTALDRILSMAPADNAAELAGVLEREAELTGEPRAQAGLWYRLGELRHAYLGDEDGALSAYREALERVATHPGARAALERMLTLPAHTTAVLDLLEPLYEAEGDHTKRVWLAEARLTLTTEPLERAALLGRIATIHEYELGDLTWALGAAARALAELPTENLLADEVERIGNKAGRLGDAASALEQALGGNPGLDASRELGLRAARLYQRLGDEMRAEARFDEVLRLDPENLEALMALERLYRSHDNARALVDVLERRAFVVEDPADRKALLSEAALLREGPLGDEPGAVATWHKVLDVDETDTYALQALATLHEEAGRYRDLAEVLEQRARFSTDVKIQAELKQRAAEVYDVHLSDLERSVEAWREVLDLEPDSLTAIHALEDLHRRRGDWRGLQDMLLAELAVVGPGEAQLPIYRRLAALSRDALGDRDEAMGYLTAVLAIVPDDAEAAAALAAALEEEGRWYELVDLLSQQANLRQAAGDRAGEVAHLVRVAGIQATRLDDVHGATEILEGILAREPEDLAALVALAQLYEAAQDLPRCREVLARAAALGGTGPAASQVRYRLGRVDEALGDRAAGEQHFEAALALDPGNLEALEALEQLARAAGRWDRVVSLLSRRAERASGAEQRAMWIELARLSTDRLQSPSDALVYLERARALAPTDAQILEPLGEAYEAAGRPDAALPIFQRLLDATITEARGRRTRDLARLHYKVGAVAEKLGDAHRAEEQYQAAYAIDAGHPPTVAALGRLHLAAGDWEKARREFRSLLLQNLDGASGVRKAEVYLALGTIHERTDEASKAVGMYERGLELEPDHPGLRAALSRARAPR